MCAISALYSDIAIVCSTICGVYLQNIAVSLYFAGQVDVTLHHRAALYRCSRRCSAAFGCALRSFPNTHSGRFRTPIPEFPNTPEPEA